MGSQASQQAQSRHKLTPREFATKWARSTLKERSAAQEHFIDLCYMLGEPTPASADPLGEWFCFEKGARKTGGGNGWADVWRRGCFAWEYKGKHKDLESAFAQLQRYAIALENPPLLVVSDMDRIEIHTNFTNTVHERHEIVVAEIGSERNLKLLRNLFSDPDKLKPSKTKKVVTEEAAQRFASLADVLRSRGGEPDRVAHFLNRVLFCLFAQDAGLLPQGVVRQLFEAGLQLPGQANQMLKTLFSTMKKGGIFGTHVIEWFNGSLFDSAESVPLEVNDISEILAVAHLDWSEIEPSIFGTLFERGLDPSKRAQIGAHYTDPASIMRIVEPVILEPLSKEWETTKRHIRASCERAQRSRESKARNRHFRHAEQLFSAYLARLAACRVLDPACGSGNFLYVALQALKDLELRAILEAEELGLQSPLAGMHVGVQCVRGIELNPYAAELARVTVWIGEIQWMLRHGMQPSKNPILKPLETIECRDAVLGGGGHDPQWPDAEVLIGNPPFLGNKRMLAELGASYTKQLRGLFSGRLPGGVDLVTYWFERARSQIEDGRALRAGFVATQSIRKGANRTVLDRIASTIPIFNAWRDESWINDGASVRVSFISFGKGSHALMLDGTPVDGIQPDLMPRVPGLDLTRTRPIPQNSGICFMGSSKVGSFEIPGDLAREWLRLPNVSGVPNADVVRPWANGKDLTGRPSDTWIVDFGARLPIAKAAVYEAPFAHVKKLVKPARASQRRDAYRDRWWIHAEARPGLRDAMSRCQRFMATPRVAKHRFFVWLPKSVLPDSRLFAICRDDDFTFGVLSSRFHTVWALRNASRHGVGNDPTYNASDCFETFPFPSADEETWAMIAKSAATFVERRNEWLNPAPWVQRVSDGKGYPPRYKPKVGHEDDLRARTLTNLYNENPTWLERAQHDVDSAVARAYGWRNYSPQMSDDEIMSRLCALNAALAADLFTTSPRQSASNTPSRQTSLMTPTRRQLAPDVVDRRMAVVCTLVNRLADDRNFGRTKFTKLFYLADATQSLNLQTEYFREAAGPLDADALYNKKTGVEALALRLGYAKVDESGTKVNYARGENLNEGLDKARSILGKQRIAVNRLIDLFRPLDTQQCEIVATLYACWNDKIVDGLDASDDSIVQEFLNSWHERKKRFQKSRLLKALAWMRANALVPTGAAPHTRPRTT